MFFPLPARAFFLVSAQNRLWLHSIPEKVMLKYIMIYLITALLGNIFINFPKLIKVETSRKYTYSLLAAD
jgi:hypothetical protein